MIDFHTHPVMIRELTTSDPTLDRNIHEVFGFHFPAQPLNGFLLEMDTAGVDQAVLLPVDVTSANGCQIVSNEQVAELARKQPRFIGFASVDPSETEAPRQLDHAIRELGLRGLNLDPAFQRFELCDRNKLYPILQICQELKIPVLIHTGMSWTPTGLSRLARPFLVEDAVQAFPDLNFILGNFGWPWLDEALMLAVKYPNVFVDTAILYSGTPRDMLKRCLSDHIGLDTIERSLATKIVFGTNYPRVDMRRCVRGMRALGLSQSTQENIFQANASRLLGMERRP
jgi:uncharacterized protein